MSRQAMVLSVILGAACVLAQTRLYQPLKKDSSANFKHFPERIGNWQMVAEFAPTLDEVRLLETENILKRLYRDHKKREVSLTVVYDASGNRKMAHPQEICLTAGGMNTLSKSSAALMGSASKTIEKTEIDAERLLIEGRAGRQLYYYWYKAGPYQSGNYFTTQLRLALAALTGRNGGTALIRLNVNVTPSTEEAREAYLQDFARDIIPELEEYLP